MVLFVELSVNLKKGKLAKDGLYQYKNTAQNTNVGTIELVLRRFIELSEEKVTEAQAKADQVQSTLEDQQPSGTNVDDLEATETPESILLSTVSGEQSKDRTDRAIVTPWLKFLWETYRTVLEILKNNARLETMYQTTALQAFAFCQKYTRKTEFRRLCELLRNHVQSAAKYQTQMHAINLSDPDTLQRHLDTRFQQLNVAVELELWQEAFRSVEDVHTLLSLSKRPAKNVMMANYYEKLTRIFMVSENYLFHAAAWSRYYNLLRQSAALVASGQGSKKDNPAVTEADMTRAASFVLLSALSIPVISTSRSRGALIDVDEARKNKNQRLTNLLGMSTAPTRAILFKDAMSKGLLKRVKPEIRELYQILEVDFHPLSICQKISPILKQIGTDPEMEKYVHPLQQVILTRLFQQLSQVYESVQLDFIYKLAQFPDPFKVTTGTIEKFIMNGCKKGDLAIRLDHASGVLTFDSDVFSSAKALHPGSIAGSSENEVASVQRLQSTPAEIVRSQLVRLSKTLFITCQYVDSSFNSARQEAKQIAFERAAQGAEAERRTTLERRLIIEKKKELASEAQQKKQKEDETRKKIQAQQLLEREQERLKEEQRLRDLKRFQDEQKRARQETLLKEIDDLKKHKNIDLDGIDLDELDSDRLRALRIEQMTKEKNELANVLRVTGKRIDHLERAFRKEEIKVLGQDYEAQKEKDSAAYEIWRTGFLQNAEIKHKGEVSLKHRLSRLVPVYESFRTDISERRHDQFEKRRKNADRELEQAIQKRKRDVRERRAHEKQEKEEAERLQREEEEKQALEEAEREAAEVEKKRKMEEHKQAMIAERAYVLQCLNTDILLIKPHSEREATAAKQRQREEEAEERRNSRQASGPMEKTSRGDSGAARSALAGKPGWRGNGEAPSVSTAPTTTSEQPRRPDTYVVGAFRGRTEGGGQSLEPRSDSRPDARSETRTGTASTYQRLALKPRTEGQAPSNRSDSRPNNHTDTRNEGVSGQTGKWRSDSRDGPSIRNDSPANDSVRNSSRFGAKYEETREAGEDTQPPPESLPPTQKAAYVPPNRRNK